MPVPKHVLVLNSGSSSLKFSLFESETVLASGIAERLGTGQAQLALSDKARKKHHEPMPNAEHRAAMMRVCRILEQDGLSKVAAVGHRVVHGGEFFE
ncbi:MAG: acetate kinase, partial [Verrucomicrobia bacterium]|nr:acetate kinase [Verrucomicrobiota bacterium]